VFQYGATLRALKIPITYAQTLPYGSTPFFIRIDYLHPARRLEREVNQFAIRFFRNRLRLFELLTNSISIRPVRNRIGIF